MTTIDPYLLDHQKKIKAFKENLTSFDKKLIEYTSDYDERIVERLRADKNSDFKEFIDSLIRLWNIASPEEEPTEIIREKSNLKEIDSPSRITYKLKHRTHLKEMNEIKPKLRETRPHPNRPGEFIDVFGQLFELKVLFTIHATTAEKADNLVEEFEDFMLRYAGFFKKNGVFEILFDEQLEDEVQSDTQIEVHRRPLIFKIRLERLTIRYQNEIEQIGLQASLYNK